MLSLGLEQLPSDVPVDATFVPLSEADTVMSAPETREPVTASLSGTLPRLQLMTPDAARELDGEVELEAVQVLGEGGMGRVLLARQSSLGREVAVKVLRPNKRSEAAANSLINEARTTGGLEHPSVVPVYALARDAQSQPALVMKRVDGLSWRELIHEPQHPAWVHLLGAAKDQLSFHVETLVQVCNAIAHAHQRGVLHRDVKPANVLLGDLGEVYLADWGVALKLRDAAKQAIRLVGTPAYLAPEMVTGDASLLSERTDVYLLGATLYEVLAGAPPHMGTSLRKVMQHAWDSAEPVLPPEAPPLLVAACKRAMAADPEQRFATATARDDLHHFLRHRGSSDLAAAAAERLSQLESMRTLDADPAALRRWFTLVSECRFGFAQALKVSPDHVDAKDGLRRCLEVATRHEVERGAAASARAFSSELEAPPPDLVAKIEALEAKDRERLEAQAQVERLKREHDPSVSRRQGMTVLFGMTAGMALMATGLSLSLRRERVDASYATWFRVVPVVITAAVYTLWALIGRRALFNTRVNRQYMALIGVGVYGVLAHRAFSVVLGVSVHAALATDAILPGGGQRVRVGDVTPGSQRRW